MHLDLEPFVIVYFYGKTYFLEIVFNNF